MVSDSPHGHHRCPECEADKARLVRDLREAEGHRDYWHETANINGRLHAETLERAQKTEAEVERLRNTEAGTVWAEVVEYQRRMEEAEAEVERLREVVKSKVEGKKLLKEENERLREELTQGLGPLGPDQIPLTPVEAYRAGTTAMQPELERLREDVEAYREVEQENLEVIELLREENNTLREGYDWDERVPNADVLLENARLRRIEEAARELLAVLRPVGADFDALRAALEEA